MYPQIPQIPQAKSKALRAKGKEQSAKSKGQRAKRKEQKRPMSNNPRATVSTVGPVLFALCSFSV
jgi:hypothetical protein